MKEERTNFQNKCADYSMQKMHLKHSETTFFLANHVEDLFKFISGQIKRLKSLQKYIHSN